jgi:hypothetical protein
MLKFEPNKEISVMSKNLGGIMEELAEQKKREKKKGGGKQNDSKKDKKTVFFGMSSSSSSSDKMEGEISGAVKALIAMTIATIITALISGC